MSRYKIVRELGRNREAGRITYLATDTHLNPPQQVVIKEFRFALADAKWSGFKAYQREIEVLQELDYPRIPRYLDSFETKAGFCLVQEYKNDQTKNIQLQFNGEPGERFSIKVIFGDVSVKEDFVI
jgi:serine/threonine protein kinase